MPKVTTSEKERASQFGVALIKQGQLFCDVDAPTGVFLRTATGAIYLQTGNQYVVAEFTAHYRLLPTGTVVTLEQQA